MPNISVTNTTSGGGVSVNGNTTVSVVAATGAEILANIAKAGTLTTRTDANTGTATLAADHGITTGQRVDIFWLKDGLAKCQHNVTVGTVSGTSVPFDLGLGDDLPVATTAIFMCVAVEHEIEILDANVQSIAFGCSQPMKICFEEDDDTPRLDVTLKTARGAYSWNVQSSAVPISGDVGKVYVSQMGTTGFQGTTTVPVTLLIGTN